MKKEWRSLLLLHLILMIYSFSGICSKQAAAQPFLSLRFCFFYSIVIILLFFYAVAWQQIIKRLPLTMAFANKAVTVVWGLIWGALFFQEDITLGKVLGAVLVIAGVVLFSLSEEAQGNG